jgi:hypothetical protein
MTSIEQPELVEVRLGMEVAFGTVSVTEQVSPTRRSPFATRPRSTSSPAHARDDLRDGGHLVPARGLDARRVDEMPRLLGTLHATEHSMIALLRCGRCATAGTSAGSRRTSITRPAAPPSSSTTGTRAASGSRGADSISSRAGSGIPPPARRLPLRERLPVLRPVAQVREPQRVPRQGGCPYAPAAHAEGSG